MKQEQLHNLEPLWNHWYVDRLLGEGSFGSVYRIKREDFGEVQYAALKVIGVPQSQQQVRQCFASGMGEEEVWQYFEQMVEEVYQEIKLMAKLKGKSNIVSYEDHEIRKRTEGIGYDILIRMELLTSLEEHLLQNSMTKEEVIHMGKDLCQALCVCGRYDIIHRDIKPANIFLSRDGDFKLGDFGIARCMQECPKDLSIKGSYTYMAPEVYLGGSYDKRVDIYSLGIVLYTYLNQKNIPFIQEHITYENKTQAIKKRLSGEKIPRLSAVPKELADVIERAVSYSPEGRFSSPEDFFRALQEAEDICLKGNLPEVFQDKTVALVSNFNSRPQGEEGFHPAEYDAKEEMEIEEGSLSLNFWKQFYVQAVAVILFFIFGGALLFVGFKGMEGVGNLHFSYEEEKKQTANIYAKEEKISEKAGKNPVTPTPAQTSIPEEARKTVEKNSSGVKTISGLLKDNHCEAEELGELYLAENQLEDIKELSLAVNLLILDVSGNAIQDFSPLMDAKELRICNVTGNPMENLDWLSEKKHLTSLWIGSTDVVDIKEFSSLEELQDLHIEDTAISDLAPLEYCENLTQLDCRNCKHITDIAPLFRLKHLQYVSLDHTSVSEEDIEVLYQHLKKENPDAYLIGVDGREYTD